MITNCIHCGAGKHPGVCPTIKAIEYYEDGTVKRVEYKCAADYAPIPVPAPVPGYVPGYVTYGVAAQPSTITTDGVVRYA